jgi:predicted dehydrogenase/threonine dehydrogenase-like Zn-dependent dehydrogenase
MKQVFIDNSGTVLVERVPEPSPDLSPGLIRVKVAHSLISVGTDRSLITGSGSGSMLKKVGQNPGLMRKVYELYVQQGLRATKNAILDKLHNRIPLGYSCAGVVTACGPSVTGIKLGDHVACAGVGFANHAEIVTVPRNLVVRLPAGLALEEASFVALGSIALQGVRQSQIALGERVLVIGMGLIGQLSIQLLRLTGAFVAGLDLEERRVIQARSSGANMAVVLGEGAEFELLSSTDGRGFDAVLVTAADSSGSAFEMATRMVRDRGTISLVGVVGMTSGAGSIIGKEVTVKGSRSYGPGRYDSLYEERGIDYPYPYVRWTEARNMQYFLEAAAQGKLKLSELISHRYDIDEACAAYATVEAASPETFGIVLNYPDSPSTETGSPYSMTFGMREPRPGRRRVAVWGLGAFAREVHLPNITSHPNIDLVAVGSGDGGNAAQVARRYGAYKAVTNYQELLEQELDGIIICGKHFAHAEQVSAALQRGISVLVEKPLAITRNQINLVRSAMSKSEGALMVGHNRKYSPIMRSLQGLLSPRNHPLHISYRIAAGAMPDTHWMLDPAIGGGRLVSELSHFVDVCLWLVNRRMISIDAHYATLDKSGIVTTLVFEDSSTAVITYLPQADKAIGKEYMEAHCAGKSYRMDNYMRLVESANNVLGKWSAPNKGYREEYDVFFQLISHPASEEARAIGQQDMLASQFMFDIIDRADKSGRSFQA